MEFNQEENDQKMNEEEGSEGQFKQWLQDNLRIVISVLIVVLIAGGIYSYSKRTQAPTVSEDSVMTTGEIASDNGDQADQAGDEMTQEKTQPAATENGTMAQEKTPVTASQETGNSFIETAVKGDGMTKLARKSLANYLEKNPDAALSAEHKIYIEDYLRKNVAPRKVVVGTSVEFSKDLIKTAIESSKTLNDKQLQNLHKYALRVPSLT